MMKLNNDQQKAVDLCGTNILVFASAGGGKTTVLVNRLMKRILEDNIPLDNVIAMTFTEAASTNMKNRLAKALNLKIKEATNEDEIAYLNSQIASLSSAKISTIHSFCLSITKEYYYLLNITKNTTNNIINDAYRQRVLDQILDDIIKEYLNQNQEAILKLSKVLSSELFSFNNLKNTILNLFKEANDKIEPLVWLNSMVKNKEINSFYDLKEESAKLYLDNIFIYLELIKQTYEEIINLDSIEDKTQYQNALNQINALFEIDDYNLLINNIITNVKTVKSLRNNEEYKLLKDTLDSLCSDLTSFLISEKMIIKTEKEIRPLNNLLLELTKELYLRFMDFKVKNEWIDFNDFEHYAYQILTLNNNEVANKLKNKYQEIMIDEFQDTNDIQFKIASLISNHNLFLVGDIKQSIYRFRGAKPSIMESLKYRDDFTQIHIKNNYRSKANLVNFNNKLFNQIMNINTNSFKEEDAQIADQDYQLKDNVIIRFDNYIGDELDDGKDRLLASRIIDLHNNHNVAFKDIAVLVRYHSEKVNIKKVFDEYHIPYFIKDNDGYFNSYAIEILFSYLRILQDLDDKISLYSILCSKLYNYDDNDLVMIKDRPLEYLKDSNFMHDYQILKDYFDHNDFTNFFAYFLNINNFYHKYLNSNERVNLDLLINKLDSYNIHTFADLTNYISVTSSTQKEAALAISEEADVVNVMTIHTSKGLEFDTVFLYSSSNNRFSESKDPLIIDANLGLGFKIGFTKYKDSISSFDRKVININNNLEDIYEYLRILYVALTRPKRILNFIGDYKEKKSYSGLSLLLARKGFSSFVYNTMKDDPLLDLHEYTIIEDIKALDVTYDNKIKDIKKYRLNQESIAKLTPSSLEVNELRLNLKPFDGTNYGTRVHELLEKLDFRHPDNDKIKTLDSSINPKLIYDLLDNQIFKEAIKYDYHKEYPFYYKEDNMIIHGIIDFVSFLDDKIILIDYKTDNLEDENEFILRYKPQLIQYKNVLSKTFNKTIETYIYSFKLNKMIQILDDNI